MQFLAHVLRTSFAKTAAIGALALAFHMSQPSTALAQKFEYQLITTIESVVPGGLGRSRMISTDASGKMDEAKMENFFSLVGINFGNVRNNDAMITTKINQMSQDGWDLHDITSGVYATESSTGIFITRYFFRKPKN